MKISVVGTGYVGLVGGVIMADIGHDVTCIDIDEAKINSLKTGKSPIYEPGLEDLIESGSSSGKLKFTTSYDSVGDSEAVFFALPTPPKEDGSADVSYLLKAAETAAKEIKSHTVFITKSTVPVGTADKVKQTISDNTDVDFSVVSNPEFLKEGSAIKDFMEPDRIVVGVEDDHARKVMRQIYQYFIDKEYPYIEMNVRSSELTKYAANAFLATKISFINEVANLAAAAGASIDDVRRGMGSDSRISDKFLNAGIGFGGSCFPKDTQALVSTGDEFGVDISVVRAALESNHKQQMKIVDMIINTFGPDLISKTFALWGLAFKPNTDDIREAPALVIIDQLTKRGAKIKAYDQEASENVRNSIKNDKVEYVPSAGSALVDAHALIIATEWQEFKESPIQQLKEQLIDDVVFDGRNIYNPEDMKAAGLSYKSIGRQDV